MAQDEDDAAAKTTDSAFDGVVERSESIIRGIEVVAAYVLVILFAIGVLPFEMDLQPVRTVAVIVELFAALDVILILIGPVQMDFFPVVGDGVFLAPGVAALGEKIAVVVIPAEEGVEVIENPRLQSRADIVPGGLLLDPILFFADIGFSILRI